MKQETETKGEYSEEIIRGTSGVELKNLLHHWEELNTPEKIVEEEQEAQQVEDEIKPMIKNLNLQIEGLKKEKNRRIEEIREQRVTVEGKLIDKLEGIIRIGNPDHLDPFGYGPTLSGEYIGELTFGFREKDAVKLLRIALENNVHIERFLRFSDCARENLEYSWSKSGSYNIDRQRKSWFPAEDLETLPDLKEVNEHMDSGFDILFGIFVHYAPSKGKIDQAREIFTKAKQSWQKINDLRVDPDYSKAFCCFLDLLSSEEVEIFRAPTSMKFNYELFSLKLK